MKKKNEFDKFSEECKEIEVAIDQFDDDIDLICKIGDDIFKEYDEEMKKWDDLKHG